MARPVGVATPAVAAGPPQARHTGETGAGRGAPGERRRRRAGTALRLAAFQTSVLAAVLSIVVVALVHQFSGSYQSVAADALSGQLRSFAGAASRSTVANQDLFSFSQQYLRSHSLPSGDALLIAVHGHGLVGTAGTRRLAEDPDVARWIARPPASTVLSVRRVDHVDQEVLAAPIRRKGRTLGAFVATSSLAADERQRLRVLLLSIAEAAVAVIGGGLSAHLLLRRLLRTVGRITSAAEEIQEGDLDRRLGDPGTGDEVSQLADTFDAMLDRLSAVMSTQRRLLSDVSHQLRTPLTVARGHLEVLARSGFADRAATEETVHLVLDELADMTGLVDSLLLLGRAIEPDFLQLEPIDLRSFLGDLYEAAVVLAARQWAMGDVPDVVVWADAGKLRGALLNVVDNAVKATAPGDPISFGATLHAGGNGVVLAVEDGGPGIPTEQRQAVLGRFTRVAGGAGTGTGLGLAIVDAVARAHGGSVHIGASQLGGALVGVVLPPELAWRPEDPHP
ncbi:MAG: sensor histidine kinase [Acidimicrobiales bacterium]